VIEWLKGDFVFLGWLVGSLLLLLNGAVAFWTLTRLRELRHVRERMSRLADGLALLTDTTEAGLATVIREVEQISKRPALPRSMSRATVARRVAAAARRGQGTADIAADESLSESEVRLHLSLAQATRTGPLEQSAATPQA
jgi:hypothetical protein